MHSERDKSKLSGRGSDSLMQVAYDYINSHGKDLHGQPLGQYFIHGIGHYVGLEVHDPGDVNVAHSPRCCVYRGAGDLYSGRENRCPNRRYCVGFAGRQARRT